jgi:hypothetical protein
VRHGQTIQLASYDRRMLSAAGGMAINAVDLN